MSQVKRLLILILFLASPLAAKEHDWTFPSPRIPEPRIIEVADPPQHIFCAQDLPCTFTGAVTATGTNTLANLDGVIYIGGNTPQIGGSADIGAQINAAYAAAPSTGQKAILLPQTGGGCYNSAVPITLNIQGKYFPIEGTFTGNQSGPTPQGTCINFTPTANLTTAAAAVSGNVATLTMSSNPITAGFIVSEGISIAGFTGGDTYFNGQFTISSVTTTQITFALTHINSSAATNGNVSHTAVTIDYAALQGGAYTPHLPLKGIIWQNNGCNNTIGGCGSSTNFLMLGPTNSGAHMGLFENLKMTGFNQAIIYASNGSWGVKFTNSTCVFNFNCLTFPSIAENFKWDGGTISGNSTGVICQTASDMTFSGVSFDINSTWAINNSNCNITIVGLHPENATGTPTAHFLTQSNGQFSINGGVIMNDHSGGTLDEFILMTGGFCDISGLTLITGDLLTNFINNTGGGACKISYAVSGAASNVAPDVAGVPQTCSVAYRCEVTRIISDSPPMQQVQIPVARFPFLGAGSPNGTASTAWMFFNGSLNRLQLENNGETADNVTSARNILTGASTDVITNKQINVPFTNGTGIQLFNTTTTCTTAASAGATCTTAAITLPVAEADTNYRIVCQGKGPTNVPIDGWTTNSSATQFTITIVAITAAAATFASHDCHVGHN